MKTQIKENNDEIEKIKDLHEENLKNIEFMSSRIKKLSLDISNSNRDN